MNTVKCCFNLMLNHISPGLHEQMFYYDIVYYSDWFINLNLKKITDKSRSGYCSHPDSATD